MLQQRVANLQHQLFQKEQENVKLKEKLQESQGTLCLSLHESDSNHSAKVRDFQKRYQLTLYVLFVNVNVVDSSYSKGNACRNTEDIKYRCLVCGCVCVCECVLCICFYVWKPEVDVS